MDSKRLSCWISCLLVLIGYSTSDIITSSFNMTCKIKHLDGTCQPIKNCTFALTLLAINDVQTLRSMFCGYVENTPMVCCPVPLKQTEETTTIRTTPQPYEDEMNVKEKPQTSTPPSPSASNLLPGRDVCGQITGSDRIYGGTIAQIDEYPWTARIKFKSPKTQEELYACAGALISDRYVLTAAHCIGVLKIVDVRLGEWDTETNIDCQDQYCNDLPVDIKVESVKIYPGFNRRKIQAGGDIALLRLESPVKFTEFIQPICLPTTEFIAKQDYMDSTYTSVGWGITEYDQESAIKRVVNLDSVPFSICKAALPQLSDVEPPNIICAGGKKGYDTCRGDSGGPLQRVERENYKANWYLYGITSFGSINCGSSGKPGVYTRVSQYMEWILKSISEDTSSLTNENNRSEKPRVVGGGGGGGGRISPNILISLIG